MDFQKHVETILYNVKHEIPSAITPIIPVYSKEIHIANLHVITKTMLEEDTVISLLTKWRSDNQEAFPTRFIVTKEGTKIWGQKHLLEVPDRILFFVETLDGKPYAHVGLFRFNFHEKSCEVDNVIRGENVLPGSITLALQALLDWTRETLGIETFYLQVFSGNERVVHFYTRCGFIPVRKKRLKKIVEPDSIRFIEITDPTEKADDYIVIMQLQN